MVSLSMRPAQFPAQIQAVDPRLDAAGTEDPGAMLALIAPSFNLISETFIANHAQTLAPGRTALICQDSRGVEAYGYPVLSHVNPVPTGFGLLDTRVKDLYFRLRRRFGPPLGFDDRMRLIAFLKTHEVTAVLAEYGPMGVLAGDVAQALGLPLHVYFHGVDASALLRHATVRRRYRRMFTQAATIICVSRYIADRLVAIGCPERLIRIVPCGVEVADFPPGTPEPGRVLALGRLVEKKAPHLTIRAFAEVAARFPQAHLDVIGEGPLFGLCEAAIAENGLGTRVTLHGAQPHAFCRAMLARAAIFAQHSVTAPNGDTEGSPVAIAEAMATALPVVSTRHSGIPEQVVEGETGYLVAERDVAGMGAAMGRLLADPQRAAAMGAAGRARALELLDQSRTRASLREILGLPRTG